MSSVLICTKDAGVLTFFENGLEDEPPVAPPQNGFVYYYNNSFYIESHIPLSEHNGGNSAWSAAKFDDDISFQHDEEEFPNSFEWKLTDSIFMDPNAYTINYNIINDILCRRVKDFCLHLVFTP